MLRKTTPLLRNIMRRRLALYGWGWLALAAIGCSSDSGDTASGETPSTPAADVIDDAPAQRDSGGDAPGADVGSGQRDTEGDADVPTPRPYPAATAWGPRSGPGVPPVTFEEDALYRNCATLDGGPEDVSDHHNLLTMYDGWLLMPWAPEFGRGGLTFFDLSDPCAPTVHGTGFSPTMRETHSIGFADRGDRRWAVVNSLTTLNAGGIEFWDITDTSAPAPVSVFNTPDFFYPDAYARVTLSVFWQDPYVYVGAAGNGVFIIDATDPTTPSLLAQFVPEPVYRVGQVQALGSVLVLTGAEVARTTIVDISNPAIPRLVADFTVEDAAGVARDPYFTNLRWPHVFYANKDDGGGLLVYDISEPTSPVRVGESISDGNGGYVMLHEDRAFVGESRFAAMYDISDLAAIEPLARFDLEGDLDTATPIGHLVALSVDDKAARDEGTALAPWSTTPDTAPPRVTGTVPAPGATGVAPTSPIGISFNELVDPVSVFEGSVRIYASDADPALGRVDAFLSAQELLVNLVPVEPLAPATTYTVVVEPDGVIDASGNAVRDRFAFEFTTEPGPDE